MQFLSADFNKHRVGVYKWQRKEWSNRHYYIGTKEAEPRDSLGCLCDVDNYIYFVFVV